MPAGSLTNKTIIAAMKVWIYLEGKQQGPFGMEELKSKPGFDENTRVWFEGLPKWYPAGSLEQMKPLFEDVVSEVSETETTAEGTGHEAVVTEETPATEISMPAEQAAPADNPYAPGRMYKRPARPGEPCPPTYLGWSVFLLICCCSPVSLAAVVASICVSTFYGQGNMKKASKASEWAAWLVMISFALGMIPMMIMSALMG